MDTWQLLEWIKRQRRRGHSLQAIMDFGISQGIDAYQLNQAINLHKKKTAQKNGLLGQMTKKQEVGILVTLLGVLILVASGLVFSMMDSLSEATVSGALINPESYVFSANGQSTSLSAVEESDFYSQPLTGTSVKVSNSKDESQEDSDEPDSGSSSDSSDSFTLKKTSEGFDIDLNAVAAQVLDVEDKEYITLNVNKTYIQAHWHPAITAALEPFDKFAVKVGNDRHVVHLDEGDFYDIDENSYAEAEFQLEVEDYKDVAFCKRAIEQRIGLSDCLEKVDVPYYLLPGMMRRAASIGIDA